MKINTKIWIAAIASMVTAVALSYLLISKTGNSEDKRIAYVESSKILAEYKGMEKAKADFEAKSKSWKSRVDSLSIDLGDLVKKYEGERAGLNEQQRKQKEESLRHRQMQVSNYQESVNTQAAKLEQEIMEEVFKKVNTQIEEYGKRNNYQVIFGTTSGNILYADDAINITEELLKELNNNYTGKN